MKALSSSLVIFGDDDLEPGWDGFPSGCPGCFPGESVPSASAYESSSSFSPEGKPTFLPSAGYMVMYLNKSFKSLTGSSSVIDSCVSSIFYSFFAVASYCYCN